MKLSKFSMPRVITAQGVNCYITFNRKEPRRWRDKPACRQTRLRSRFGGQAGKAQRLFFRGPLFLSLTKYNTCQKIPDRYTASPLRATVRAQVVFHHKAA